MLIDRCFRASTKANPVVNLQESTQKREKGHHARGGWFRSNPKKKSYPGKMGNFDQRDRPRFVRGVLQRRQGGGGTKRRKKPIQHQNH